MSTARPMTNTVMVFGEQPFHSFRMMPHTFENTTLSAIRMQKAKVISTGDEVRKPLPSASPKNWLYHNTPARAQKTRLFVHTLPLR